MSSLHRAALGGASLPDGSGFSPAWRPREDVLLGEGILPSLAWQRHPKLVRASLYHYDFTRVDTF